MKKFGIIAMSLALVFTVAACGKKRVKIELNKAPADNRLVVFQGEWETNQCITFNDGLFGRQLISISGNEAQFTEVKTDALCGAAQDYYYGDIVTIVPIDNNKAKIVDEFGNVHNLTIAGSVITDDFSGRTFEKQ